MKVIGYVVAPLLALLLIIWALQGNDFFLTKVFAPKYEQVRRETFEQSKAYNQGMIQELQNMEFEYVKAAPEQQDALASIILHRVADYDIEKLPADLRAFVLQLRHNRLTGGK
jgi:predicted restriction endonuclease